ncbi:hypothetical protein CCACVL1_22808 [Corchorus capsularis]|uniref:Myb/SANT-like domain-containing protein n=1 Tax=Corchorus capsularis TaxID=210143 RepID=A0A1R3GWS2_COCAP|nr:hypothetical protein CCACVL1_22808 [Corchorus capsularis]
MGGNAPSSSDRTRVSWTPTMERYFIDLMLDQMHRGNRLGHTFNKQAWTDMLTIFNAKFGCKYDRDTLKSHYTNLWKQYNDVKNLLEQNGFAWDDARKLVVAPPHVWDAYVKAQPEAQVYRNRTLMNFNDLCLIYAYTQADGRYSRSSHDIDFDDDAQGVNFGVGSIMPLASDERPKIEWTAAMDQYFIELMLGNLNQGNKSKNAFNKQAWNDMLASFNAKFCFQLGKGFLRRRYRKLLKQYTDVQNLLQQKEFSWDERQQMVVADDLVWDNYIMAHPDARTYRNKKMLNYQDLRLIYGNARNNGSSSHMNQGSNTGPKDLPAWTGVENNGHRSDRGQILGRDWTSAMNCYLTDLLFNQALGGNKIGHSFVPEAWSEMVAMFNLRFGCNYDEDALKSQARHLRRQYNDIKILLEQNRFSWDATREMVIAEGYVWDAYIKEHPYIQSYRNKSMPDYHKLCVIFGQESSNGRCSMGQSVDFEDEDPDLIIGDDTQFHASSSCSRTDWTPSMDRHLIDLLLEHVHRGNRNNGALDTEVLMDIALSFMETFGLQPDEELLRNHHKSLGKQYRDMKKLLDQRVFSWNERHQMVTADDDVWDTFIKEDPDLGSYRNISKPNYSHLCLIYGNSTDGKHWRSSRDASCNGYGTKPNNGYCVRTDWIPSMDRYFIDLMLEQVRHGSMLGQDFNRFAWADMVAKFSSEFGRQYDKDVLKSRFINLRKRFNDMKCLLGHDGFAWNEMQQMIIADDNLWSTYLKEHPDARSYRNRTLPNYNDLFLIYGNASINGWHLETENYTGEEEDESPTTSSPTRIHGTGSMGIQSEIENDTLDMGFNDIFGDLQCLAAEFEIPDQKKRRKTDASSIPASRKAPITSQETLHAVDERLIGVKTSFNDEDQYPSSIENIVDALQAIPGMDDVLFLDASKLLEDEQNAQMFLEMDVRQRRKWLLRKLRR